MFCFNTNAYVMMYMHKWWFILRQSMMLWQFFSTNNYGAKSVTSMKYPTQHANMWFSYQSDSRILIPILIPLGLIPILIPIPGFIKINDSGSNSDSRIRWFRFWFRFQCFSKDLIPIMIPIPASFDSASDSNKPGFDSYSDSGIWFRFRNHLQLWLSVMGKFCDLGSFVNIKN